MKEATSYTIHAIGESESAFRGARPESIDPLLEKPDKDTKTLIFQAAKAQVELCLQSGDIAAAWEAIRKYQEQEFSYQSPLNCFQKDNQNGNIPYIGGHAVFGAIRDAAKFLYSPFYDKKGSKNPAKKHFRKSIKIRPTHIFFYRPNLDGSLITEIDEVQGQQPTEEVKGFAKYEAINSPFQFQFFVNINPKGPFEKLLSDTDKMIEIINQASNHGLGAGRGVGYGIWKVLNVEVKKGVVSEEGQKLKVA